MLSDLKAKLREQVDETARESQVSQETLIAALSAVLADLTREVVDGRRTRGGFQGRASYMGFGMPTFDSFYGRS